tara:strand:- start:270 stop:464 length:195 start_codon:yes stop_codon:yes gene_type:complete
MFWQTTQEKEALAAFRADRRHREELQSDLRDFREIFWHHELPETKTWALHMIKSIEHELHQLDS